ncbi:MAG: cell division protein FtsQ [Flavobacterium sp.]|nr:cell division protein FtsQ [Flavobacterium sp.]
MSWFKWSNIRLILMFALMAFLYSFTSMRNEKRKLVKSEVVFVDDSSPFIKQESVNKLLIENKTNAQSIRKDKLDLNQLEKSINSNPMIEKSEVFVSIDGVLKAVVKQKTPIARVFNDESSFYIDYQGNIMPLSDEFTARVPIISGDINNINKDDFSKLLRYIWQDDFLKKNIIGMQISPVGSIIMQNRNFNYEILFGKSINIERKFQNYKAFYQKTIVDSTLLRYKRINLTFTQQVVCTK